MKLWNIALSLGVIVALLFVLVVNARIENLHPDEHFDGEDMHLQEVYRLYIGLNDVENNSEVMPINEARELVDNICVRHGCGFTSFSARGGWIDNEKKVIRERTLVYMISFATEDQITIIMDEVMDALGQTSILLERQMSMQRFYYRKQEIKYPGQ
ncbi:MAG: DUF3574 domain-containing protein [Treponema sp.]|nr:DUF3574 domain-containing protein [Treponema sp.]